MSVTHLKDCYMREEGLVVVDGDFLKHLVHVDRPAHVVERAFLTHRHWRAKQHALDQRVVPRKISVPREQAVDESLRMKWYASNNVCGVL